MKQRESLTELFNECLREANTKPPFINNNNKAHKKPYETISSLISELTYLIKPMFINEKDIFSFLIGFEIVASEGFDSISSMTLYFSCINYINNFVDRYLIMANDTEEYETAKNFKVFRELRNKYQTRNYIDDEK